MRRTRARGCDRPRAPRRALLPSGNPAPPAEAGRSALRFRLFAPAACSGRKRAQALPVSPAGARGRPSPPPDRRRRPRGPRPSRVRPPGGRAAGAEAGAACSAAAHRSRRRTPVPEIPVRSTQIPRPSRRAALPPSGTAASRAAAPAREAVHTARPARPNRSVPPPSCLHLPFFLHFIRFPQNCNPAFFFFTFRRASAILYGQLNIRARSSVG